jgi:hypothetical protein
MNPDSAALHPGYHARKSAMPARNKIKNNSALSAPLRLCESRICTLLFTNEKQVWLDSQVVTK